MKDNKIILIIFCLIILISLWLINNGILFKDDISSRAEKVFLPKCISSRYYGQ